MTHDLRVYLFLLLSLALLGSCKASRSDNSTDDSGDIYTPHYATGFSISSLPDDSTGTVLTVSSPWQGADNETSTLVLASPARRIVTMSSTHVAMLDALGCNDRIVGVSGLDFICTPSLLNRRDSVIDVGYDSNVDYEAIVAAKPDVVLLYGVYGPHPMENKLEQLNIPYIYIGDYMEQSPIGKAEWIVALGEIVGERDRAIEFFNNIPAAYNSIKARLDSITEPAPKVLLNTPYGDAWYMPPVGSYMVTLIEDAGGNYLYSKNDTNRSVAVDMEEIYLMAQEADVWLNPGIEESLDGLAQSCPRFTGVPAVRNHRVYNNNSQQSPIGGNAFYETAVIYPHLVLRDLIKIFHPDLVKEDFEYYRQLQ